MDTSDSFSLEQLTTYKEGSRLEFKSARGGLPNSLWESYSAFANSDGGVIVLGIKENTKTGALRVEGLDDAHKMLKDFWNMVNNRQKISCNILTDSMARVESLNGKNLIVIKVPRAERTSRPVYMGADPRTGTYRRNFEGDYHCSIDEVSLMIRDSALVTDDNTLLTDFDVSVFCQETINSYRNIFRHSRQDHLWNKDDDALFLRHIGAVRADKVTGKFHPTVAGLLMFGYEPDIATVFPNYFLDYQENRTNGMYARWTDRITSQSGDWSGNVFDFLLRVIPKLQADLKVPFMFQGNLRRDYTPLHKTIREAMVNMLANADYYGRRGVVVQKSAEGFKFANPGSMRVSLSEAIQDSASDPRNGAMMKMLAMVEYGERAGSGLQGIFKTWQSVYQSMPELEVSTSGGVDRTTLTLDFEGRQPDIEAMKQFYDYPEEISEAHEALRQYYVPLIVPQNEDNAPEKAYNVPQKATNAPQSAVNVLQKTNKVPQNSTQSMDERIIEFIRVSPSINRDKMAQLLSVNPKTIARHLKSIGIVWEGHPKTGHWLLPPNLV